MWLTGKILLLNFKHNITECLFVYMINDEPQAGTRYHPNFLIYAGQEANSTKNSSFLTGSKGKHELFALIHLI